MEKTVKEHFNANTQEQVAYTTPDGNLFTAKNKHNATYHAKRTGQEVTEHINPDYKPEAAEEETGAEDKNQGKIDRGLAGLTFNQLKDKAVELGVAEELLKKLNSKAKLLEHLETIK